VIQRVTRIDNGVKIEREGETDVITRNADGSVRIVATDASGKQKRLFTAGQPDKALRGSVASVDPRLRRCK
jgi:hypothetical protein